MGIARGNVPREGFQCKRSQVDTDDFSVLEQKGVTKHYTRVPHVPPISIDDSFRFLYNIQDFFILYLTD